MLSFMVKGYEINLYTDDFVLKPYVHRIDFGEDEHLIFGYAHARIINFLWFVIEVVW